MEKSKRDLESLVVSQKEQLIRYETRLKDVVTAYKGLLKEKEALEASLSALTGNKNEKNIINDKNTSSSSSSSSSSSLSTTTLVNNNNDTSKIIQKNDDKTVTTAATSATLNDNNLQLQLSTLMNSLATLSAEKSRMESSFQADKKQLRQDILQKDKIIHELQEKIENLQKQNSIDLETIKSKLIVERHEREKESNNHMIMIRELQKLYSDERHIKDNYEMQLNDLKNQLSTIQTSNTTIENNSSDNYRIKELIKELNETKDKLKKYENLKDNEKFQQQQQQQGNSTILLQLQNEMQNLKQQHSIALKTEQKRVLMAEERNKKLAAIHEDRVANLESRLAELSITVGTYDRLRQQDQENIQKLKDKIIYLASNNSNNNSNNSNNLNDTNETLQHNSDDDKTKNIEMIINEIMKLKKLLLIENEKNQNSIDINKIFDCNINNNNNNGNCNTDHSQCINDYNKLQNDYDLLKLENNDLQQTLNVQKNHIKTLQDKIKVLNSNIDEQDNELKSYSIKLTNLIKQEKSKSKDIIDRLENDYRCKLNNLEMQLQKQRVRSLQLLDEKENEIKALKTSFEIFNSTTLPSSSSSSLQQQQQQQHDGLNFNEEENITKNNEKIKKHSTSSLPHLGNILGNSNTTTINGTISTSSIGNDHSPILHYINELARKDVEITSLRKSKYTAETTLRQALQDKVAVQEELNNKILRLEEQVDRLERCKTREGANLEYLKNVIINFLTTNNIESKHHMVNAIGAVLQFTSSEMKSINNLFPKK